MAVAPPSMFVVGDIHGCAEELKELLARLPLTPESQIVFLGDYIDRGPNSKAVIDIILNLQQTHSVITLLGNHEAMFLEFYKDPSSSLAGFFILNGGSSTLASYVNEETNEVLIPDHHMEFFKALKPYHETEKYFFVHAGVPEISLNDVKKMDHLNEMLWIREPFLSSRYTWSKKIIHGHTPSAQVEKTKHRINLDTGCVYRGYLSAIELPSEKIYQVRAREDIPHVYLQEQPYNDKRVAKRFSGEIPVFVATESGYLEFQTLNYNEFGMLILEDSRNPQHLRVGQILKGKIGALSSLQIEFTGQVVRHQKRGHEIAYGVRMIEPLSRKK